ncbi:pilus assembly protein PilB [Desulfonema ishimotonii]|uniref:Pilus assembly protein PilB n=1 Tax=Desulfonema ishimotonii TaxID=45657 RepID=A0A401FS87_9BACT|nr:GspE/PulE family protein [Desulfonema ishimotonii]GBC59829.1 pilus assembly protein PilB [Desulfonema ishimotonii]
MTQTKPSYKKCRFGECALSLGFLDREKLDYVASRQKISKQRIGHICVEEQLLDSEQVARVIAMQYDYPYIQLEAPDDPELFTLIPVGLMKKYHFIPWRREDDRLVIAMSRPRNLIRVVDELEMMLDSEIGVVIASEERIHALTDKIGKSVSALDSLSDDIRLPVIREAADSGDILSLENVASEESLTVKLVNSVILDAINKGASDIHIEASDAGVIIRYRIDGMLYQATDPLDSHHQSAIISRIKVMSELDISEKRVPQDGRFKINVSGRFIDFRISVLPTIFGEDAVIRILDRESLKTGADGFRLEGMGLPEAELRRMRRMIRAPYGMFLMTGPTGSGKTTTLYRALSEVNRKDVKIITIEDPVEYRLKGIVQIQVNEKKGLTFARGLRSVLRHDPDKILVGEIRDAETAQIAIQSALTGHLVFTTVHANRSFEVINRFAHMGIDIYDLVSALNCVVAQRLIRTLCSCRQPTEIPDEELTESGLVRQRDQVFYRAVGCEQCNGTGFRGRKAVLEMVALDDDMRALMVQRAPASALKKQAGASGTVFLRQAALAEVVSGVTTLDEANRITFAEAVA